MRMICCENSFNKSQFSFKNHVELVTPAFKKGEPLLSQISVTLSLHFEKGH